MTTRPLPAHGTTARAYGSPGYRKPCKCAPCREARRRHQKRIRVNRELGRSPFTDPAPAQAHLKQIHRTMPWKALVAATGLEVSNLMKIYNGERTKIRHETEAKILAVVAPEIGGPGQCIDATGTIRRVQALAYVGHAYSTIARVAHTSPSRIMLIANGRQATVRRAIADRLATAYQQLAYQPPRRNKHTSRTRNVAREKSWHGPLAWADNIDDPSAKPEKAKPYKPVPKNGRDSTRKAEIEHLYLLGESVAAIAKRLGANEKYTSDQLAEVLRERAAKAAQERAAKSRLEAAA